LDNEFLKKEAVKDSAKHKKVIVMSLIKNKFFEEKIGQLFEIYPIVLLFHYNNITSKEWLQMKKKLFQINPSIVNKVVPNRFLSEVWQNIEFETNKTSDTNQKSGSSPSQFSQIVFNNEYNYGSSCLFFCSNGDDLKNIMKITGNDQNFHEDNNKMNQIFNTSKFINIGMIDKNILINNSVDQRCGRWAPPALDKKVKFSRYISNSKALFLTPYDIQKMLKLDSNIYFQLYQSFNKNENLIVNFHRFLEMNPTSVFHRNHYNLINILSFRSSMLSKANNGN
jgi:hypothetical protein